MAPLNHDYVDSELSPCRTKVSGRMYAGYTIFSELRGRPKESDDRPLYSLGFSRGRRGWWRVRHDVLLNAAASPGLKRDKYAETRFGSLSLSSSLRVDIQSGGAVEDEAPVSCRGTAL